MPAAGGILILMMAYAIRERKCRCGTIVKGRLPPFPKPIRCIDCLVSDMNNAARQMAQKQGDVYIRWQQTRGPQGRPPKQKA